jgi:regulator of protease activity HflC (stomatin/prohibitin superfamily)
VWVQKLISGEKETDLNFETTAKRSEMGHYEIGRGSICVITTLVIGIIILCACLSASFHYIEYDQYGLLKDNYGTVRLSKVYEQGRYFFPLNYDMIIFPAHYIEVDFNEAVFTDTGLEIEIEVGFYYQLPRDFIGRIYNDFSLNYHSLVLSNSRTTIKDEAAKLKIDQYITNRSAIELVFAHAVSNELNSKLYISAPIELFRIGEIQFPDSVLETSLESAISIQNNELLKSSQAVALIKAETQKLVTEIDVSTTLLLSYATNEASRIIQAANSYANQVTIKTRGTAINALLQSLNFTSSNQTMKIIEKFALLDNADSVLYIDDRLSGKGIDIQVNSTD